MLADFRFVTSKDYHIARENETRYIWRKGSIVSVCESQKNSTEARVFGGGAEHEGKR